MRLMSSEGTETSCSPDLHSSLQGSAYLTDGQDRLWLQHAVDDRNRFPIPQPVQVPRPHGRAYFCVNESPSLCLRYAQPREHNRLLFCTQHVDYAFTLGIGPTCSRRGSTRTTVILLRSPVAVHHSIEAPSDKPIRATPSGVSTDTASAASATSSGKTRRTRACVLRTSSWTSTSDPMTTTFRGTASSAQTVARATSLRRFDAVGAARSLLSADFATDTKGSRSRAEITSGGSVILSSFFDSLVVSSCDKTD